jgi:hypothetical protein
MTLRASGVTESIAAGNLSTNALMALQPRSPCKLPIDSNLMPTYNVGTHRL